MKYNTVFNKHSKVTYLDKRKRIHCVPVEPRR